MSKTRAAARVARQWCEDALRLPSSREASRLPGWERGGQVWPTMPRGFACLRLSHTAVKPRPRRT
jgi:hypothetical protein